MNPQINQTEATTTTASELNDAIRNRAYELYEQRGRADGDELDDWIEDENEVLGSAGEVQAA